MPDSDPARTYQSPFTWRYGSPEMRRLWSEEERALRWRQVWVALAEAQALAGLVTPEQAADLRAHAGDIDLGRREEIEAEIRHDLMAEVRVFAGQCPAGGPIIHLGATSMDVKDNADAMLQRDALDIVLSRLSALLTALAGQIEDHAEVICIGWTHLQPAEPTTVGYRLAGYAQDLLADEEDLRRLRRGLRGKGIKGAVGTGASFAELLAGSGVIPAELEARVMASLGLEPFPIAQQTYPRRQDWALISALAGLGGTLYRFAFDLRLLQSPPIGEWSEPFGASQVGSSAMPFKRNPVNAENIDSLGRYLAALPRILWDNAAHSLLERTLDDSANRRTVIPEAFLAVEHMLITALRIIQGLQIDREAAARNMAAYGTFAAAERLLMALGRAGADRQEMHERIRQHSMAAWEAIRAGRGNPLTDLLAADSAITAYVPEERVRLLMDASAYTGDAAARARALAARIRATRQTE
jgi:adenylosuccinate lyase